MLKYFKGSFWVTVFGLIAAYIWGHYIHGSGSMALFIVIFLSILEVTLSFDNAVINAVKLEKMNEKWRHRFITWGIIIAVFGMRLLFPIIVVAIFAKLNVFEAAHLAFYNVDEYTKHLDSVHALLITFGGSFLFMIFFSYFFCNEKECYWIKCIEKPMTKLTCVKYIDVVFVLLALIILQNFINEGQRLSVILSGLSGILTYLIIDSISNILENIEKRKAAVFGGTGKLGFIGFLYLELIDASFSLDGVLGAFAISKDIVIICIGLAIGAMFVRSLTIFMVEKKTLQEFIYLEHGAHWAIGFLALIMFISTKIEVSEIVTGSIGLFFVGSAFISSVLHNKKIQNISK